MVNMKKKSGREEPRKSKDYDPEDDVVPPSDSDDSALSEQENNFDGREHYEKVQRSRLRTPNVMSLDPKYRGVAVSRDRLNGEHDDGNDDPFAPVQEDEDEDPFAAEHDESESEHSTTGVPEDLAIGHDIEVDGEVDEDEEIDSDEAFADSDADKFKDFTFRGSKSYRRHENAVSGSEITSEDEDGDSDASELESGDEEDSSAASSHGSDISMGDGDEDDQPGYDQSESNSSSTSSTDHANTDRSRLKALSLQDSTAVAASLSGAANADIKKGKAVQTQRQIYDRLLDTRIKFQKGLTATNNLPTEPITDEKALEALNKAEEAALTLWSTIDSIRCTIHNTNLAESGANPRKRKRTQPLVATRQTSTTQIWQHSQHLEMEELPVRKATLDKWSARTRSTTAATSNSRSNSFLNTKESKITDILEAYLTTETNKIISSSTTSTQPSNSGTTDSTTTQTLPIPAYDDTLFYQSLLRDLIASRSSATTNNNSTTASTTLPSSMTKLHPSSLKTKKVDTKASKGRKVRYTVHEKLQNFMAPEDRTTWEDRAKREFFGSLFGNSALLDEDGEDVLNGGGEGGGAGGEMVVDKEEEALRLFRS